ncbi:MAG TPA: acyl-CoA dehydrogenase family protein [Acidimicrobiales bacterium]|nr:acyl-CoA dehydrogenase family protein [Acidimicrobiales bacterium]
MIYDAAREDLLAWRDDYPANPYDADTDLRDGLGRYLSKQRLEALDESAREFAFAMVHIVAPSATRYEQRLHLPELSRFDAFGRRTEEISFDPSYHVAGEAVWKSGVVSLSKTPGTAFEQMTLLYLLCGEGEAGHACPVTCTIGLARALRRRASPEVRRQFLNALVEPNYQKAQRGAQFLTEVQGGSDVGANACVATPQDDGTYLLSGEKWFCSVANADQFFVTARVGTNEGTRGLGSFVVPRTMGGAPNGFNLRRLKDKLGTRGLASGEIDFAGARAWPVGPLDEGFRTAVGIVLNTSRWMTAVGSVGIMRRAYIETRNFAHRRRAFGSLIEDFAVLRLTLADMAATTRGALALVLALTDLEDRIDLDTASDDDVLVHRFLVNATKLIVSQQATRVVRSGIEVLGGNGTIEEFSVLPRLYRDSIVFESWEGTHNVLAAQVLNDLGRMPMLAALKSFMASHARESHPAREALNRVFTDLERCVREAPYAAWHFRERLETLGVLLEALLCEPVTAAHLVAGIDERNDQISDEELAARVDALVEL